MFDPRLKKILAFSVEDRYQLNYFICIKDFNAETITSLKLNLFSFFICGCQHQRKAICLYVYISDIRQIVGYRTPIFIQPFPWRLHITITYNLPHLRLCWRCHSNSVNTGSRLPRVSDVKDTKKTERGRNWHDSKQPYWLVGVPLVTAVTEVPPCITK